MKNNINNINNINENCADEMELMKECEIFQIREDLPGDVLLSAKLVDAAWERNWDKVEKLLDAGADPRICRKCSPTPESALYYALLDQNIEMANKLYHAGDRLDDLFVEDDAPCISPKMLYFLATAMRCGQNYFYDESKKTLSECVRCSAYQQIEKLLPKADKKELTKSVPLALSHWIHMPKNPDRYFEIISDLIAHGAEISEQGRTELLEQISRYEKFPAVIRAKQEDIDKMRNLIKNA